MKSIELFEQYSKNKAWEKTILSFRSSIGLEHTDIKSADVDIESIMGSLSGMSTIGILSLLPIHHSSAAHLKLALEESGINPESLSKKKVSLLSFVLNAIGFSKFDDMIDQIIHKGGFVDIKSAIETDDDDFVDLIFSVLKTIFPPLGTLEGLIRMAVTKF